MAFVGQLFFIPFDYSIGKKNWLSYMFFHMFKISNCRAGIRGTPIELSNKAHGILNTHRENKAYGTLIKRFIKMLRSHRQA